MRAAGALYEWELIEGDYEVTIKDGLITAMQPSTPASLGDSDVVYSVQPTTRFAVPAGAVWYYTGQYLTITNPTSKPRRYLLEHRLMALNIASNTTVIMTLSTSSSSQSPSLYYPHQSMLAGSWGTIEASKVVMVPPGTQTYYEWVDSGAVTVIGGEVGNAKSDARMYGDLYAIPMD